MIIGDMEIRLRADIARLQRDMDSARQVVGNATAGMERAAGAAKAALASIAGGLGLQQLAGMVDEYAKFTAQLKLATQSQREYSVAYADVKRISTQSTQGLQETGVLYARIANGTRELGVAQQRVAAITETVNLSLLVSGATASEAASAQLQLSQAFASGTLRGEEFNAVNEAAPRLMQALADGIGVPVGALKKMAGEGEITSKIMADVLPNALVKLREEAKQVQTIAGAFTVLRNEVMEFVGMQAQANGVVATMTSGLGLLAENLTTVAGVILTLTAVKLANWLGSAATKVMDNVTANRALIASNLAVARAEATAAAQASLLANARLAEVRAATLASSGNTMLALTANGLVPAQGRAAAASGVLDLAMTRLAVAQRAAALSSRALGAALALTGGPLGLIVTVLGTAAMAWSWYKGRAEEANAKAAASTEQSTNEIIEGIEKQNEKLRERIRLSKEAGMGDVSKEGGANADRAAALLKDINALKAQGNALDAASQIQLIELQGQLAKIKSETGANVALKRELDANGAAAEALVEVRQRLSGVNKQYLEDLAKLQAARAVGAVGEKEYISLVSQLAKEEHDRSAAGKSASSAAKAAAKDAADAMEKERVMLAELAGLTSSFAEDWDRLGVAYGKGKLSLDGLTKAQAKLLAEQPAMKKALEEEAAARKAIDEFNDSYAQGLAVTTNARQDEIDTIKEEVKNNERLVATFGMSESAIGKMEVARIKDQLAQRSSLGLTLDEIEHLEALVTLKERSAQALANREELERTKQFWSDIEQTAHDTFVSITDGGKNAFQRLKDTAKNTFFDWLYQMTVKKWIINIGTSVSGTAGVSGFAQAAGGGGSSGSTALDLISTGKKIYDGFATGFASVGSTLGGYVTALGNTFGSASVSAFGAGMGMTGSQAATAAGIYNGVGQTGVASGLTAGSTVGAAAGAAAGIAGGIYGGRLISGGYSAFGGSGNSAVNTGTAVGAAVGSIVPVLGTALGALIGGVIGGSVNRLFGHKAKEIVEQGISGNFSSTGFSGGQEYSKWTQKGGVFRSDKSGTDTAALSSEMNKALTDGFTLVKDTTLDFAKTLGVSADVVNGYSKQLKLVLTKDAAQNQELLSKLFTEIGDEIATRIVPSIAQFKLEGETASVTLQRLTGNFQVVDAMLVTLGATSQQAFNNIGVASIEARERLIAMSGGIDALAAQTQFYADNFLTKAEQIAPVQKQLNEQLALLGFAGLTTADQFKEAVQGLVTSGALATERGAEQYSGMLAMAPQFKVFADYLKEIGDAAKATALEEENRVRQLGLDKMQLSIQIMELEGNAIGALNARRAQELASVDESLRPLYQRIYALQDEKTAMEAAAQAAQAATQAVRDAASSLLGGIDSSFSVLQSIVSREKAAVQSSIDAHTESVSKLQSLSQALRGTLDSIQSPEQKLAGRAAGQAQISAALAIARAGGQLPGADSLKDALSAVQQDASDQFSSYTDYLRDLYRTQNDIGALAGLTDAQLSVEEKALQATRDQLAALDAQLASTQALIDAAKGQSTTLLSIDQGIAGVRAAILAAQANPVVAATSAINNAYQTHLGRAPDAAGLDWWKDAAAGGAPISQIVSGIAGSAEADLNKLYQSVLGRAPDAEGLAFWMKAYGPTMDEAEKADWLKGAQPELQGKKIPGFANGGDFGGGVRAVGEVGVEIEATGPSRIHSTQSLMDALRRPSSNNNDGLAAAVERLSATVERQNNVIERQGAALEQIQRNTRRQADTLDVVTEGGNGMRVTT